MTTYAEILNAALALPPEERDLLAETLVESLETPAENLSSPEISEAWRKEIARRSAEVANGTAKLVTFEEMVAHARRAAGFHE